MTSIRLLQFNNQDKPQQQNGLMIYDNKKFKPSLPQELMNFVFDYLRVAIAKIKWKLAVGLSCGCGHLKKLLTDQFDQVYQIDVRDLEISSIDSTSFQVRNSILQIKFVIQEL